MTVLHRFVYHENTKPSIIFCSKVSSSLPSGLLLSPTFPFNSRRIPSQVNNAFLSVDLRRSSLSHVPLVQAFSASRDDSAHSKIEVQNERSEIEAESRKSEEAWKQALETFKAQALKMQEISQEAYELYSIKATVILKEASEKLKIQAEKAKRDLSVVAKEISEGGEEYISNAAKHSPEVKEIVETFASSSDKLKDISDVRDFYIGIPYGTLLAIGGFLSFMLTGSTSGIRFGIILGGALLTLSVSSLRSWRKGKSTSSLLKGQTVIAGIIFIREARLLSLKPSLLASFMSLISGSILAFYLYRFMINNGLNKGPTFESEPQN